MRLLIVDDSPSMRAILRRFSRLLGYGCVEAADGLAALACLRASNDYEAVLLDWDMPHMNGLELLREIRASPELDGLKVLMVTSQISCDHVAAALLLGADDYLMKPLDRGMLADKLRLLGLTPLSL